MNLPNDPAILLSYINTMLRDNCENLDELCKRMSVSRQDIEKKIASLGYAYNSEKNRFM